jgi:hypothetical protein
MKAAVALGQLGEEGSAEFAPVLEDRTLYDPCRTVREKAALALVLMGRHPCRRAELYASPVSPARCAAADEVQKPEDEQQQLRFQSSKSVMIAKRAFETSERRTV